MFGWVPWAEQLSAVSVKVAGVLNVADPPPTVGWAVQRNQNRPVPPEVDAEWVSDVADVAGWSCPPRRTRGR